MSEIMTSNGDMGSEQADIDWMKDAPLAYGMIWGFVLAMLLAAIALGLYLLL